MSRVWVLVALIRDMPSASATRCSRNSAREHGDCLEKNDESAVSKEDRCDIDGRAQRVDRCSEKSGTMGVGGDGMQLGSTWRVAHQSDRSELDGESKPDQGVAP